MFRRASVFGIVLAFASLAAIASCGTEGDGGSDGRPTSLHDASVDASIPLPEASVDASESTDAVANTPETGTPADAGPCAKERLYQDADRDGFGDSDISILACPGQAGYVASGGDCDDRNPLVRPSAKELCDDIDNDCDGSIDEELVTTVYADRDGDGFGDPKLSLQSCRASGFVADSSDCDDGDATRSPGQSEVCDGKDNNCNGVTDEDVRLTFYRDADGDGFGDSKHSLTGCVQPTGFVQEATDCNDSLPAVHPGAPETCNQLDDNCNDITDENLVNTIYPDRDRDGYGDSSLGVPGCGGPGLVGRGDDCDDGDSTVHPGLNEVCDGKDNNCDKSIDEGVMVTYYRDADSDGFGDPASSLAACTQPMGFTRNNTDCEDSQASVHPGASEECNGLDDDCNGQVDGQTRACDTLCSGGTQTCVKGAFGACTAPEPLSIGAQTLKIAPHQVYESPCVLMTNDGVIELGDGAVLRAQSVIRLTGTSKIVAGAGARIEVGSTFTMTDTSRVFGTDLTLKAQAVEISPNAQITVGVTPDRRYSAGGGPFCTDKALTSLLAGAGGGIRGGNGGLAGYCGSAPSVAVFGAGGPQALAGEPGCSCDVTGLPACTLNSVGGRGGGATAGSGGGPLAGGGGGANGGKGGKGGGARVSGQLLSGGDGGLADALLIEPEFGGSGAGSGGGLHTSVAAQLWCSGQGGAGAGILRIFAASLRNQGLIGADGERPQLGITAHQSAGGGGGGSGGSLVFRVDRFENSGMISAVGAAGADGYSSIIDLACNVGMGGGGGGGGGGIVFIINQNGLGPATLVSRGTIQVTGGVGGKGGCGSTFRGEDGEAGWVQPTI